MENNEQSLTLTVTETARLLRISRSAAYQALERKQLPSIRIGRRLLIPRKAIENMLEGEIPAPAHVSARS